MPETVIVTIYYAESQGRVLWSDFELPFAAPFASYQESLENAVKNAFPSMHLNGRHVRLIWDDMLIGDDDSMLELGIFDGGCLSVRLV